MATDPSDFDDAEWDAPDGVPMLPKSERRSIPEDLQQLGRDIQRAVFARRHWDPNRPYYRFVDRFDVYDYKLGGMGMVLEAYDTELDRRVAIKLWLNRGSTASMMLMVEARALAKLSHPNVVTIHDAGKWNDRVYFVMEWIDGSDGRTWMLERRRTWEEIRDVFLQAAAGLAAAHDVGIQHRDFKPANMLIGRDGRVRVADFGVADVSRGEESNDAFGPMAGTLAYMAPERLRGDRGDAKSDQFSFCVSMWEAMFKARPFEGNREELLEMIMDSRIITGLEDPWLPEWSIEAVAVGLMPDPKDRYSNMQELILSILAEDDLGDEDDGGDDGENGGGGVLPAAEGDGGEVDDGCGTPPPVLHEPAQDEGEVLVLENENLPLLLAVDDDHAMALGGSSQPAPGSVQPQVTRWIGVAAGLGSLVAVLAFMAGSWWATRQHGPREGAKDNTESAAVDEVIITPDEVIGHIEAGTYDTTIEEKWTAEIMRRTSHSVPTYDDNRRISEALLQRADQLKERDRKAAWIAASTAETWSSAARADLALYGNPADAVDKLDKLDERIQKAKKAAASRNTSPNHPR